jgi:hypothetical protein
VIRSSNDFLFPANYAKSANPISRKPDFNGLKAQNVIALYGPYMGGTGSHFVLHFVLNFVVSKQRIVFLPPTTKTGIFRHKSSSTLRSRSATEDGQRSQKETGSVGLLLRTMCPFVANDSDS